MEIENLNDYLDEDGINNIYTEYKNVFVVKYDEDAKINNRYVGRLILKVNITKDRTYIKVGDYIDFRIDKVKWKNGEICIVDPYWVKVYLNTEKLSVEVKILKSKVEEGKRIYFESCECIDMTYKQFINRRLLEEYRNVKYSFLEAYSNFQERRSTVGYYRALNETSKHYLIAHDELKNVVIPRVNNSLKKYKKEWENLYLKSLEQNRAQAAITKLVEINKTKSDNVIKLKK